MVAKKGGRKRGCDGPPTPLFRHSFRPFSNDFLTSERKEESVNWEIGDEVEYRCTDDWARNFMELSLLSNSGLRLRTEQ